MGKSRGPSRNELLKDYFMLNKMSRNLALHQKNVRVIGRKVAKTAKTDLTDGIVDNLDLVVAHMKRAQSEIDKAQKKLKQI
jgi:hypothetical protein